VIEPTSVAEAQSTPQWPLWAAAMEAELLCIEKNGTFEVLPLPKNKRCLTARWVFKLKYLADGTIARYKARLVVRGFLQRHGVDYHETFAPVSRYSTFRVLIALAAGNGWLLRQLDIETAFLHSPLKEEIWLTRPAGYATLRPDDYDCTGRETAWLLRKTLYGLKQSPREFHKLLASFLKRAGFKSCHYDPCLFTFHDTSGRLIAAIALYVDDLSIGICGDLSWYEWFKIAISKEFNIKDLGELDWCLNMEISRYPSGAIGISQQKYIVDILDQYGMADSHPVATPLDDKASFVLDKDAPLDVTTMEHKRYQSMVGSLNYLANSTRPDISYAVGQASKVLTRPTQKHICHVKRILRYLNGTRDLGVIYSGTDSADNTLLAYCDASLGDDLATRRSTAGYVLMLNGGPIEWSSRTQPRVAGSSSEAEFKELYDASKAVIAMRGVLDFLSATQTEPTPIFEDNTTALGLANNEIMSNQTRHIEIRYFSTREFIADGLIRTVQVSTLRQVADIFTKALPPAKFVPFRTAILGRSDGAPTAAEHVAGAATSAPLV
jgi:hypothetical protein